MHYVLDSSNSIWNDVDNAFLGALTLGLGDSLIVLDTGFVLATGASTDALYVNAYATDSQVIVNGIISGTRAGIYSLGTNARIIVNGEVIGGSEGVSVSNGGQIIVNTGGSIQGGEAVSLNLGCSLINNGTITSYYGNGIQLVGGSITNNGLISGPGAGLFYVGDAAGYIKNTGTVNGGIDTYFNASALTASLNIDNSGLWNGDLRLTAGDDTVTNTGRITGGVSLGDGSNTLDSRYGIITGTISCGSGTDYIRAGAEDDTIAPGAGVDTVDAGGGVNTIDYSSSATGVNVNLLTGLVRGGDAQGDHISHFQNVTGGLSRDVLTGDDGNNIIYGVLGKDTLNGNGGNDTLIELGTGTATINGGAGNDLIQLLTAAAPTYGYAFSAFSHIDGGAGDDTLEISNAQPLNFGAATVLGIEHLIVDSGFNYNFNSNNTTVAAAQTLEVDGGALTGAFRIRFDGSAETDGKFIFEGGAYNDIFIGGTGADSFAGSGGADMMTGGGGADLFSFDAVADSAFPARDRITDFAAGTDKFQFNTAITGVDAAVSGTASTAADLQALVAGHLLGNHAIRVDVTGGALSGRTILIADANGAAGYQSGGDFCIDVTGIAGNLTTSDFIV